MVIAGMRELVGGLRLDAWRVERSRRLMLRVRELEELEIWIARRDVEARYGDEETVARWLAYDMEEQTLMSAVETVGVGILMVASSLFVSTAVMAVADPSQADPPLQVWEKGSLLVSIHHAPDFRSLALTDVAPLFQPQD